MEKNITSSLARIHLLRTVQLELKQMELPLKAMQIIQKMLQKLPHKIMLEKQFFIFQKSGMPCSF
ncbi:MAG TPA: hypothetical protein DCO72_04740 [Ruminococcus sp.]|nr:hypothetical protein [Ruminococcus sp.]